MKWSAGEIPGDWSNTDEVKDLRQLQEQSKTWCNKHSLDVPYSAVEHVINALLQLDEAAKLLVGPAAGPVVENGEKVSQK